MNLGSNEIEAKGMIPAQYLGMWPGHWTHLYNLMVPFPKKKIPNVSKKMKKKGIVKRKIIRLAENFFVSIGMLQPVFIFVEILPFRHQLILNHL